MTACAGTATKPVLDPQVPVLSNDDYDGPNVYWHDWDRYRYPSVTLIAWAVTPTGRRSRTYFAQGRAQRKGRFADDDRDALIARAYEALCSGLPKVPKGYTWGKAYIQFDFSR